MLLMSPQCRAVSAQCLSPTHSCPLTHTQNRAVSPQTSTECPCPLRRIVYPQTTQDQSYLLIHPQSRAGSPHAPSGGPMSPQMPSDT